MSMVNATAFILKGNSFLNMSARGIVCNGTSTSRVEEDLRRELVLIQQGLHLDDVAQVPRVLNSGVP